jgi:2-dehydropantoate 2-reductase
VVELAELTGHETPLCRAVLALVRERGRQAGCYPDSLPNNLPGDVKT